MANAAAPEDGRFTGSADPVEDDLGHLLTQAASLALAEFREDLRGHGVSSTEWRALSILATLPGQTVGQLAVRCLLQQPTMTKLLERVVRAGMVRREASAGDRRVVRLRLTPEGEALVAGLAQQARRHEHRLIARLPDEEVRFLKAALRRLISQVDSRRSR